MAPFPPELSMACHVTLMILCLDRSPNQTERTPFLISEECLCVAPTYPETRLGIIELQRVHSLEPAPLPQTVVTRIH